MRKFMYMLAVAITSLLSLKKMNAQSCGEKHNAEIKLNTSFNPQKKKNKPDFDCSNSFDIAFEAADLRVAPGISYRKKTNKSNKTVHGLDATLDVTVFDSGDFGGLQLGIGATTPLGGNMLKEPLDYRVFGKKGIGERISIGACVSTEHNPSLSIGYTLIPDTEGVGTLDLELEGSKNRIGLTIIAKGL